MQESNTSWSKSLKQSQAKPNQLCFWNCTSCKNVCAIITEVSWCVGSVVRDMAAQWWWWLLFWWVGVGNKTQALSVERRRSTCDDVNGLLFSQFFYFWHKGSALQTVCVRRLTGNNVSGHYFCRYLFIFSPLFPVFFLPPSQPFLIEGELGSKNLFSESG